MTSEKQVCGKCGSSELQTVYFKQDLDPVEKKVNFTFNKEFREGWTKTYQCLKCENIYIKTNLFR